MSLFPFLAVATLGAALAVALRGRRRAGTLAGFAGVAAALLALVLTVPGETLQLGGVEVAMTPYARVLLGVGLAGGLLVLAVSRLATWEATGPATLLVAAAGLALALGVGGAVPGLLAVGATSALAAAVALAHPATPLRVRALARELRGATLAMAIGILAVSLAPEAIGGLAVQPRSRAWPWWPRAWPWATGSVRSRSTPASPACPTRHRRPSCRCSWRFCPRDGPWCSSAGPPTRWGPRPR
jgi:hypothetical protein